MATRLALRDLNNYASREVTQLTLKELVGSESGALVSQVSTAAKRSKQAAKAEQKLQKEAAILKSAAIPKRE